MRTSPREPHAEVVRGSRRPRFAVCVAAVSVLATIVAAPSESSASDSVNGRLLIASGRRHEYGLVAVPNRGGRPRTLIPYGGDISGVYSPDGTKIAFSSNYDGDLDIYVMDGDGTSIRQLTKNSWADSYPSWSPDGTQLAFTSNRDGDFDIYAMKADGTNPVNLTGKWSQFDDDNPHWSPDGTRIAYSVEHYSSWDVWEIRLETDWASPIFPLADGWAQEWFDSWSPDGKHFLIESDESGDFDIYMKDTPSPDQQWWSSEAKVVGDNDSSQGAAVWSPDGTQIAFSDNRDGDWEVYVMNAEGGVTRQVTHNTNDDILSDWQSTSDIAAPTVRALASEINGKSANLRYRSFDNSGKSSTEILVYDGRRPVGYTGTAQQRRVAARVYSTKWRVPKGLSSKLKFCVRAYDASGNESKRSCAPLKFA